MVASIFNAHGYDTKHRDYTNKFGYTAYEHEAARKWLYSKKGDMGYAGGEFCKPLKGIESVFNDGECVKVGVEYWGCFKYLQAKVFCVRRDPDQIAKSLYEKNKATNRRARALQEINNMVMCRVKMLDEARDESGGIDVDVEQIVAGDLSGLKAAFEHHGLVFDEGKARACIQSEKFKHR
jgi:hypothetical protein